jgi:hypothetical protein
MDANIGLVNSVGKVVATSRIDLVMVLSLKGQQNRLYK